MNVATRLVQTPSATAGTGQASGGHTGSPRIPGIDGLRAIAILIVMASHAGLGAIVPGGFGVTLFFFLSGYLITTLLRLERANKGRISLGAFYRRRALRILPPMYLAIGLSTALSLAGLIANDVNPAGLLTDMLFLTNYAGAFGVQSATKIPLWSLDVEEHYYMVFPLLFVACARGGRMKLPAVLAAICVLALVLRFVMWSVADRGQIYYWSHTRVDSIIFGAILAVWQNPFVDRDAWHPRPWQVVGALAVVLLTLAVRDELFRQTVRYTLQGAALFVLFSAAIQATGAVAAVLNSRALRIVALLSYSLYLVHYPLLQAFDRLGLPWSAVAGYAAAFAWSAAIYGAVERPIARLRARSLRRALQGRAGQPQPPA